MKCLNPDSVDMEKIGFLIYFVGTHLLSRKGPAGIRMAKGRGAEGGRAVTLEEQNRLAVMEGAEVPLAVRLVPTEGGQVSRASLQPSPKRARGAGGWSATIGPPAQAGCTDSDRAPGPGQLWAQGGR